MRPLLLGVGTSRGRKVPYELIGGIMGSIELNLSTAADCWLDVGEVRIADIREFTASECISVAVGILSCWRVDAFFVA